MKVYVVETDVYEQRGIAGIYSSLEAAQRAHPVPGTPEGPAMRAIVGRQTDPTSSKRRDGGWREEHPGYWHNGFDMGWSAEIAEWEVE